MQSPPGGNQNGNGFPPGAGWPPPQQPSQPAWGQPQAQSQQPAQPYPPTQAQPAWQGQPQQIPPTQMQPAFPPPPTNVAGSPFRPSPNDPYASYGQINAQPTGARPAGPNDPKLLKNPRGMGLLLIGLGLFLGAINYWNMSSSGRYYIKAMFLTPFAIVYGVWLLVTGQPVDPATGKPRMWWRVGSGITLAAGLGLGGLALSYVGC